MPAVDEDPSPASCIPVLDRPARVIFSTIITFLSC
jgi:hypothetical protein